VPSSASAIAGDEPNELKLGGSRTEDSYYGRLLLDIYKEAFKRLNRSFQFVSCAPSQCGIYILQGNLDGEIARGEIYGQIYPDLVRTTESALFIYVSAFSANPNITIHNWNDLRNSEYKIGYTKGYFLLEKRLLELKKISQLVPVSHWNEGLQWLKKGTIDIYIGVEKTVENQLTAEFANIKNIGRVQRVPIYAYFNKKHAPLAEKLAKALKSMKRDGTMSKIYNKFDYQND